MKRIKKKVLVILPEEMVDAAALSITLIADEAHIEGREIACPDMRPDMTVEEFRQAIGDLDQYAAVWVYGGEKYACFGHLRLAAHRAGIPVTRKRIQ